MTFNFQVNQYLTEKPLYLPDHIAPLAAAPAINLFSTGNGTGYAEVLSYCTCDTETNTPFAICDKRSNICNNRGRASTKKKRLHKYSNNELDSDDPSLKEAFKFGVAKVIETVKSAVIPQRDEEPQPDFEKLFNFTSYLEASKSGNLSYVGLHFTLFEDDDSCRIDRVGSKAKTFWLWETNRCTPIFLHSQFTSEYYRLGDGRLDLLCEDANCTNCRYSNLTVDRRDSTCHDLGEAPGSYHAGRPLIYSWQSRSPDMSFVSNVFFSETYCAFHPR